MDQEEVVEFGPFRLQPARRLLTRGSAPVPLGDRAFDILLALVGDAPEIVTKGRLIERVWPGLFVEEASLRVQISQLRRALGDGDGGKRYIANVAGRGYCFVAPATRSKLKTRAGIAARPVAAEESAPETNLPRYLTNIIGREAELAGLRERLEQHRLVTLTGPGGVGKTRLAVGLGWLVLPDFPAGVWLVDLAPLTDPAAVVRATAAVVGATLGNDALAVQAIAAALGKKRRLLIFDNCEYLAGAAADLIRALLERVPALSVLATSQQTLQIAAEQVYALAPLTVPPVGATEIGAFGAAELFVERARAADASFELDPQNRAGIAEICRRLDGLPLALEMAAARLRLLGLDGLRTGLADRLKLLKGGERTGEIRHGSLQAVVEWSHRLLESADQRLFRRLAIFPGGFTLEAAVAVGIGDDIDRWTVMDALGRLVDRSLVTIDRGAPPRYRLLETLRLYAGEKLRANGDHDEVAERHARHFVEILDQAYLAWETTPDADWVARYRPEIDSLRAVLDWTLAEPERYPIALALGGGGLHLFHLLAFISEGLQYFERLVALIDQGTPPALEAGVLRHTNAYLSGIPVQRATRYVERATSLYRELGDRPYLGAMLMRLGNLETIQGRYEQAKAYLAEASELIGHNDLTKSRMALDIALSSNAEFMGDTAEARDRLAQLVNISHGSRYYAAKALANLALLEYSTGNIDRAIELGREAVREAGAVPGLTFFHGLSNLGAYLLARNDLDEARACLEEAFSRSLEAGSLNVGNLQLWAVLAGFEGRSATAARLIGFIDSERGRIAQPREKTEERLYGELMKRLEAALPAAELASLREAGAGWTKAEAIEFIERQLISSGSDEGN